MGFITVKESTCLNYNYKKSGCRHCRDICPQNCWNESGGIETARCDGCGLCQAACPVDAIGVEGISAAAWIETTRERGAVRHFSCLRNGVGPWTCLGFLTARDIVAFALAGAENGGCNVVIHNSGCRQCKPAVGAHLEHEIEAAEKFIAKFGGNRIFQGETARHVENMPRKIDRRSFFNSLLKSGAQTARNALWPEDATVPLPKAGWRVQELRKIKIAVEDQNVFPVLSVAENCIACGLCAKVCPTKAITAVLQENSLELMHAPCACSGCGLCLEHCPEEAVKFEETGGNLPYLLIKKPFPHCNECGAAFQPAGRQLTCFECLMKGRRSIFEP